MRFIDGSAKMDFCKIPEDCRIYQNVVCKSASIGEKVSIGNDSIISNSEIGNFCEIERRNFIRDSKIGDLTYTGWDTCIMWADVGKFCSISRMVDIGGNEHNYHAVTTMPDYKFKALASGRIVKHPVENMILIGNDVWIGQGVTILRKENLSIGDGAVIGAGSVVTKSIPPYAVAAGVPARVIKYRFPAGQIEKLLEIQWWNWPIEKIRENWDGIFSKDLSEETFRLLQEERTEWMEGAEKNIGKS